MPRAAKKFYYLAHAAVAASVGKDNSYGAGFWPMPARFSQLPSLISCSNKILDTHRVFPDEPVHMFTVKSDTRFSIAEGDLKRLVEFGLNQIKANDPGHVSLYFKGDAWKESDWR